MNKKVAALTAAVIIVLVAVLHFVPVQKNLGYLVVPNQVNIESVVSDTCVGHFGPVPHHYRIIAGGWSGYKSDKTILVKDNQAAHGDSSFKYGCSDPVDLRLYIL